MTSVLESEQIRTIEKRIEQVYELPPMPELGTRILELRSNPNASAQQLANIVQLDPSLAAQVIRYASSPYYGYRGRITNVQEAISRVLGYDMVFNLALGLAVGRSFRIPDEGPLGLTRFWEHAVCSAILVQKIGTMSDRTQLHLWPAARFRHSSSGSPVSTRIPVAQQTGGIQSG
jgi:HD-like signal output (HDOD) protein